MHDVNSFILLIFIPPAANILFDEVGDVKITGTNPFFHLL